MARKAKRNIKRLKIRKLEKSIDVNDWASKHADSVYEEIKELDRINMQSQAMVHTIAVSNATKGG